MKLARERSHLILRDLDEQPQASYVLLVNGQGIVPSMLVAADIVHAFPACVKVYRKGRLIMQIPSSVDYCLYDYSLVDVVKAVKFAEWSMQNAKDLKQVKLDAGWPMETASEEAQEPTAVSDSLNQGYL